MTWFIRADGSRSIGLGHVMRSLAIAETAVERGQRVAYVMADDPVACALPERRGYPVHRVSGPDDQSWLDLIERRDVVVFDGYPFLTNGVPDAASRRQATRVMIDDHDGGDVAAEVVVNPSAVPAKAYTRARFALCGPSYALVRREFMRYRPARRPTDEASPTTLLATLGGSDATGVTDAVLDALDDNLPFDHVLLVVGPAAQEPRARPWLEIVRDPGDVPATFARADAAISAAGSTTWELLCLGVPTAVMPVAENQQLIATTMRETEAALVIDGVDGIADAVTRLAAPSTRARQRAFGLMTVDGLGAWRVVEAVLQLHG